MAAPPNLASLAREAFLTHQIAELEVIATSEACEKQPGAAVAARKTAADFHTELLRIRATKRAERKPASHAAHEAEILRETRKARQSAVIAESFVAASNLLKAEKEQLDEVRAKEDMEKQQRLEHLTEAEIVAMLAEQILSLPAEVRERVRAEAFPVDPFSPVH